MAAFASPTFAISTKPKAFGFT
jgi:hypothetical protein